MINAFERTYFPPSCVKKEGEVCSCGDTGCEARRLCKSLSEIVARCSYAIYLAHSTVVWPHNKDLVIGRSVDDAKVKAPEICLKPAKKKTSAITNVMKLRESGITKLFFISLMLLTFPLLRSMD